MHSQSSRLSKFKQALLPASLPVELHACRKVLVDGGAPFLELLLSQDLGPLWHHTLQSAGLLESLPAELVDSLREARIKAVAGYLSQKAALEGIDQLFSYEEIPYVVMKGAHVRECVYVEPSLRSSSDIDILVAANDRQRAAKALQDSGYTAHVELTTISHEATFSKPPIDIDLHWNIMRPGRTRIDMTAGLLERRQRVNGFWGLSDADALFLMLTHPAFAKYVCSPNMGLARVADFLLWVQHASTDWNAVVKLLDQAGLKSAAWSVLSWFRMLAPAPMHASLDGWLDRLRPGRLRAAYLQYWLLHDLPSRWLRQPLLIQIGFTLFMHDRMADVLHALLGQWRARRNSAKDAHLMLGNADAVAKLAKMP